MSSNNGVPTVSRRLKRPRERRPEVRWIAPRIMNRDQVNDPSVERNRRSWPPSHHLSASARPTMAA